MADITNVLLTVLLVIFNGLLALFTYRLWKATSGLWSAAQEQSKDMKRSLEIATEATEATKVAADAAHRAADAATLTASAAKASFIKANRPRLVVRHVQLFPLDADQPPRIRYVWANIGGTSAHLFESNSTVLVADELPAIPDYSTGRTDEHTPIELTTGQFTVTGGKGTEPLSAVQIRGITGGSPPLFVYGYVKYKDDNGTVWQTAWGCPV